MTDKPIACSLAVEDRAEVAARYARATDRYRATVRFEEDRARVMLRGDKSRLAALLDEMVPREAGCCSFLRFDRRDAADGYRVDLTVDADRELARPLLEEMVAVLFPTARQEEGPTP